ncbi:MAG: YihY family inner membrane protein, partial [Oligoflexus sp.]|nr:YihY family inner membrane protein [Oligoflexus sp.]
AQDLVGKIESLLANIDITKIGIVGFVTLFVVVIFLLRNIEIAFNQIWQVEATRTWYKRSLFFWLTITLGGVCLSVFISLLSEIGAGSILPFLSKGDRVIPTIISELINLGLIFGFFFIVHKVVPNRRVSKRAALVGGMSAALMIRGASFGFGIYTAYSHWNQNIYAALSVVPLFLLWLYVVWIVVLFSVILAWRTDFGMEASRIGEAESGVFTSQNFGYRDHEIRVLLPFIFYRLVCRKFESAKGEGLTFQEISGNLKLPPKWLKEALDICLDNSFVVLADEPKISGHSTVEGFEGRLFPAIPLAEFQWFESLEKVSTHTKKWLKIHCPELVPVLFEQKSITGKAESRGDIK